MKHFILILFIFLTNSFFGRVQIDSVLSIEFPQEVLELDTTHQGVFIKNFYTNNQDSYIVTRSVAIDSENYEVNTLSKNHKSLKQNYHLFLKKMIAKMSLKSLIFKDSTQIDINGFIAYKATFKHEESDGAELILLELNGVDYLILYSKVSSYDENRKNAFFNSIKINDTEHQRQIMTWTEANQFLLSTLKSLLSILFCVYAYRFFKKHKSNQDININPRF